MTGNVDLGAVMNTLKGMGANVSAPVESNAGSNPKPQMGGRRRRRSHRRRSHKRRRTHRRR